MGRWPSPAVQETKRIKHKRLEGSLISISTPECQFVICWSVICYFLFVFFLASFPVCCLFFVLFTGHFTKTPSSLQQLIETPSSLQQLIDAGGYCTASDPIVRLITYGSCSIYNLLVELDSTSSRALRKCSLHGNSAGRLIFGVIVHALQQVADLDSFASFFQVLKTVATPPQ